MTTDLENSIRTALAHRGNAITTATLQRTAPCPEQAGEGGNSRGTGNPLQLVSTGTMGPRKSGHQRAATWLSVAAVAALIATSAALTTRGDNGFVRSNNAAGSPTNSTSPPVTPTSISLLRTLHFAINLPAGYQLTDVTTSADGTQDVRISTTGNATVELLIDPPGGSDRHFAADARPITVAGRPGLIGSTWTDATVTSKSLDSSISWKYNDAAYAVFLDPSTNRATLLALARRIDFSKHTPVRVATSVHKLPAGTHLAVIDSTYLDVASDAAYPWDSTIMLSMASSPSDAIRVELCKCASPDSARGTAETRQVNGKTAYIYPSGAGGGDIEVDEGKGVTLHVTSSHDEGGQWTGTTSELLELARAITVTDHPDQPDKWFDAATALP